MTSEERSSDRSLARLVDRLFLNRSSGFGGEKPQLFVGELPPDWEIALPDEAEVIGALKRSAFHAEVAFDLPGNVTNVADQLEMSLTSGPWQVRPQLRRRATGFVHEGSSSPSTHLLFCDYGRRRQLTLIANADRRNITSIRLIFNTDPTSFQPCEEDMLMRQSPTDRFPVLSPPPGMTQRGGGGGGGGMTATIRTSLFGELSPEAVEAHYRTQLAAAGWQVAGNDSVGRWAWSGWEIQEAGEQSTGLLTVVAPPGVEGQVEVTLQATRSVQKGGSWTTYGARQE